MFSAIGRYSIASTRNKRQAPIKVVRREHGLPPRRQAVGPASLGTRQAIRRARHSWRRKRQNSVAAPICAATARDANTDGWAGRRACRSAFDPGRRKARPTARTAEARAQLRCPRGGGREAGSSKSNNRDATASAYGRCSRISTTGDASTTITAGRVRPGLRRQDRSKPRPSEVFANAPASLQGLAVRLPSVPRSEDSRTTTCRPLPPAP